MYRLSNQPYRVSTRTAATLLAIFASLLTTFASAQDAPAADAKAAMIAGETAKVWWNQTRFAERLALSDTLRLQMDARLILHLETANTATRDGNQKKLNEALVAAEWDAARAAVEALNTARAEAFSRQTELKIEILQMLEPNQLKALLDNFPRMLERPWVRPSRGDGNTKGTNRKTRRGR